MTAPRRLEYDKAATLYEAGATLRELGARFGVNHETMRKALIRRGCMLRSSHASRQKQGANSRLYRGGSRHRNAAASTVRRAVKAGKLERQPCEECGSLDVVAHHDDYNKPLKIRWLCHRDHHKWHQTNRAVLYG